MDKTVQASILNDTTLSCEGKTYTGTDKVGKVCRELVKKYRITKDTLKIYRGSMLCLTVDIQTRALLSLREADKRGLHYVRYVPFDCSRTCPDSF